MRLLGGRAANVDSIESLRGKAIAVSDQGKLSSEFTDLATLAEDAIDAAAPEIERLRLNVEAKTRLMAVSSCRRRTSARP